MISEPGTLPEPAELLDMCDRALGEIGRRSHLFAWLRPHGAGHEAWLAVDSYYPRRRLVVVCREADDPHAEVYRELIPKHGLRLLALSPRELGGDRDEIRRAISRLAEQVAPAPPAAVTEVHELRPSRATTIAQAAAALAGPAAASSPQPRQLSPSHAAAVARAARFASASASSPQRHQRAPTRPTRPRAPRPTPSHPKPQGPDVEAVGLFLGLSLVVLLLVEMYLDVAKLALDGGQLVLAFGVAIEAVARALGTVAARRAGSAEWAWACALCGSPVVMAFTLFRRDGPISADPAPLAGLLSLFACSVIALALLGAALGA